jgi:co-chaperonin GroES (HSP10)|tara:strand:+ start:632 stop:1054 length:423 start_codon:yes stop_codon:yes gene_type:complete
MSKEIPDKVLNFDKAPEKEEKTLTKEILENQKELLPQPTGYRVLILPRGRDPVTKGGIQLAKETIDRDSIASVVGYVVAVGPDAYKDKQKFPDGPWCKKGDWILFGRYAGARFRIEGGEMRLLNDDEILAMLPDPEAVDY